MSDFGSSLFKVQSGEASFADILSVLKAIAEDPRARQRCAGLGNLVNDMSEAERKQNCEALVSVFFSNYAPEDLPDQSASAMIATHDATVFLVSKCCPPPYSKWVKHVLAVYDKNGKATRATVVASVAEILGALEQLWGVPGHLVQKR